MNVLFICDYAAPYSGNFIEELEAIYKRLNIDEESNVVFALTDRNLKRNNQWVEDIKEKHPTYFYPYNIAEESKLFRKLIKQYNIDIVHLNFTYMKDDIALNSGSVFTGVKKIKHYRSAYGLFTGFKKALSRFVYRDYSYIAVSKDMEKECRQNFPMCPVEVILNSVSASRLDKYEIIPKSEFCTDEGAISCFMMGYDMRIKGIDLALDVVERLRKKYNICLSLSVSSNRDKIEKEIIDRLSYFPEWLKILPPRNDIATYYKAADICLSPSRTEGGCTAIVEEAYCEKTIVASTCRGQYNFVGDYVKLRWFETENAEDFYRALEDAILNPDSDETLKQNKHAVIEHFGLDNYSNHIVELYSSIAK